MGKRALITGDADGDQSWQELKTLLDVRIKDGTSGEGIYQECW